jgi:hypothetical protein
MFYSLYIIPALVVLAASVPRKLVAVIGSQPATLTIATLIKSALDNPRRTLLVVEVADKQE